jgi:hypothetical protein
MSGDVEVLYAIKDLNRDQKLKPKTVLGYNAAGDLLTVTKEVDGETHKRTITDPDVVDRTVVREVEYSGYVEVL